MRSNWWRTSIAFALAFLVGAKAFADAESLILKTPAHHAQPQLQTAITAFSEHEAAEILEDLNEHLSRNPTASVIVATAGSEDALSELPALLDLQNHPQAEAVVATSLDDVPAPTAQAKAYKLKILKAKAAQTVREKRSGILISFIPATGGSLFMFLSADYMMATASFGIVLGVNLYQNIFTQSWEKISALGDKGGLVVAKSISRFAGKPLSRTQAERAQRVGRVGWTAALNAATGTLTASLNGGLDSVWSLLYSGWSTNLETLDKVFEEKLNRSEHLNKVFVPGRATYAAVLDFLNSSGVAAAQLGFVGTAAAATLAYLIKPVKPELNLENAASPISGSSTAQPRWVERIKVRMSKIKNWFHRNPASTSHLGCGQFLASAM